MIEPERPRRKIGIVRALLLSLVVVVGASLFLVIAICGGGRT